MKYKGFEFETSEGSENYYYDLPKIFIKGYAEENEKTLDLIKELLDHVTNYGGQVERS